MLGTGQRVRVKLAGIHEHYRSHALAQRKALSRPRGSSISSRHGSRDSQGAVGPFVAACNAGNDDKSAGVVDLVDDAPRSAVYANAQPPKAVLTTELGGAIWPRVVGEGEDRTTDGDVFDASQPADLALGGRLEPDSVGQTASAFGIGAVLDAALSDEAPEKGIRIDTTRLLERQE